jgi:hypothetical protein
MHFLALVTGENVDEQLWKFSVHNQVEPYEVLMSDGEIESMAKHYKVKPADLAVLAEKMEDWQETKGVVRDGRLGYISTHNPDSHLDWYSVGGQWEGFLKLRQPRRLRRFFGLLSAGSTMKASSARKDEIDAEQLLADPPAVLVHGGKWFASEIFAKDETLTKWKTEFAQHFVSIPGEMKITVVDVHN